ncbi:hypothetical protein BCH308197_A0238 (plasmid) [Bacillus cereus H3081.97]|nr:hypothetical protein BCH308197_A0238 [Bacillus cereus H3081.97]
MKKYYALQIKNILSRIVGYPGKVINTKGERVFYQPQINYVEAFQLLLLEKN